MPVASQPVLLLHTPAGPVACRVVRHPRARNLTVRVGAGGVRVTVPPRTPARTIAAFLDEHADRIARALAAVPAALPLRDGDRLAYLDGTLTLAVVSGERAGARLAGDRLTVRVPAGGDPGTVVERWYRRRAAAELAAMARVHADALGVRVARVTIRDPRSRWGSCTAGGNLSLSWRLLLAPAAVADHVAAHEVCHLRHLDHSPAFWDLLRRVDPRCDAHRSWLREHGPLLALGPRWRDAAPAGRAGPAGDGGAAPPG